MVEATRPHFEKEAKGNSEMAHFNATQVLAS